MAFLYSIGTRDPGLGARDPVPGTRKAYFQAVSSFPLAVLRTPSGHSRRLRLFRVPDTGSRIPRSARGFTLLEMLAVIVLLGIVGVIVARSVSGSVDKSKWNLGKTGVGQLSTDVEDYALDNGSPPKSLQDLLVKPSNAPMWNGPYAKQSQLTDPFGNAYGYAYPGKHGQFDIIFYGQDGKPGGEKLDRDYGNWQ